MGQMEVFNFLQKKRGKFFSARTIINQLGGSPSIGRGFHKIRKRASFYGVDVKVRRMRKTRVPIFLLRFPKIRD